MIGPKLYVLRNILKPDIIAAMSNPLPLPTHNADGPLPRYNADGEEAGQDDDDGPVDSGALIRWEKADGTASGNVGLLGVRTVILCLVLCLGRIIHDGRFNRLVDCTDAL